MLFWLHTFLRVSNTFFSLEFAPFFTVPWALQRIASPTLMLRAATPTPSAEPRPAPAAWPDVGERERQCPTGAKGLKTETGCKEREGERMREKRMELEKKVAMDNCQKDIQASTLHLSVK